MDTYRYLIFSRSDNEYTAELTCEYILYGNEYIRAPTFYMSKSGNYSLVFEGGDFLIKCVDYYNNVLFTTSYKELKNQITALNGKEKIKQLYYALENKKSEYIYENMVVQMKNTTI